MRSAKKSSLETELRLIKAQLAAVVEVLQGLGRSSDRGSYTVKEWRARHSIPESQYHKLKREGRTPRLMSTGDVGVRISHEADLEWIRAREAEAEQRKISRMVAAEQLPPP